MDNPLRYVAREITADGYRITHQVSYDAAPSRLILDTQTCAIGTEDVHRFRYEVDLHLLDPEGVRIEPGGKSYGGKVLFTTRHFRPAVKTTVFERDGSERSYFSAQFQLPLQKGGGTAARVSREFGDFLRAGGALPATYEAPLFRGFHAEALPLLAAVHEYTIPTEDPSIQMFQTVTLDERSFRLTQEITRLPRRFHGRWRFPLLATDPAQTWVKPVWSAYSLQLYARDSLDECEWWTGKSAEGKPTLMRGLGLHFRTEADALDMGHRLETLLAALQADLSV